MNDATLRAAIPGALETIDLSRFGTQLSGKVREMVRLPVRADEGAPRGRQGSGERLIVTTDRVSAFDRVLGTIPFKGQVLTQLAAWWFRQVEDLVDHHLIDLPDPNVMRTRDAVPLPVEVVVRGHLTGSTSTSLWTLYQAGVDRPYGLDLPRGLPKHARLDTPVITPTTKAQHGAHDEPISAAEVAARGLVDPALWEQVQQVALAVFQRGRQVAERAGLVLADTKYELGLIDGQLVLIDELHTMDSSRYWDREAWEQAMREGEDPPSLSKEQLRLWLKSVGYAGDGPSPPLPDEVKVALSRTYIETYQRLTRETFVPGVYPVAERILGNLTSLQTASMEGQR